MKVISLSANGVKQASLVRLNHPNCGPHLAFLHGSCSIAVIPVYELDGFFETRNYRLMPLLEEDRFMLVRINDDDTADEYLVLWDLSPELLGDVDYMIDGNAWTITEGYEADGTPCPVVHVNGPCRLLWYRALCHDSPIMEAVFDGKDWTVHPINNKPINSCDIKATDA
jgi:hypothetical protein